MPRQIGNLRLYVKKNKDDAREFFARDIARKLRQFRDIEHKDVLFLSSGGSSLAVLDRVDPDVIGPYLTIGIFDERFDPTNRTSNYAQLRKTDFYKRAVARGCRLIDTSTKPGMTLSGLAEYFEFELRHWRQAHPRGVVMATMGVARNGHTGGIMPFPEDPTRFHDLFEGDHFVVGYDVHEKDPFRLRATATLTFFRSLDIVGVFIIGEEKGAMFRKLIDGDQIHELPGRIIKSLPRGAVYVDESLMRGAGYEMLGQGNSTYAS